MKNEDDSENSNDKGSLQQHYTLAYRGYHGTSFSPEERARRLIDECEEELSSDLATMPEEYREQYRQGYEKRLVAWLTSRSGIVSPMIAGRANFPAQRMQKKMESEHRRCEEFINWRKNALKKIAHQEKGKHYSLNNIENMETINEKTKFQRPEPSTMRFIENAQWKKDEEIMTATVRNEKGEHIEVAHITLLGYDDNKKPKFKTIDAEGKELLPETNNLYHLKRDLKNMETELTQGIQQTQPVQENQQQNVSAPAPVANAGGQEKPITEKRSELKKTRTRKDRNQQQNNEQIISH